MRFVREMGCTAEELRGWLPGASRHAPIQWLEQGAVVGTPQGPVMLRWQRLEPRRIALVTLPRLEVAFDFGEMEPADRQAYMRHFDLYTQRGGG